MDWAAVVFTFVALWLIGFKHLMGPVCMAIASICWVALGYLTQSMAMMVANTIFIFMNLWTLYRWSRTEES